MRQETRSIFFGVSSLVLKWLANGFAINCVLSVVLALINLFGSVDLQRSAHRLLGESSRDLRLLLASTALCGILALLINDLSKMIAKYESQS